MSRTLMRVAMLTPEYVREGVPHGGLANYLSKICPLLKERGHCPVVFLLGDQNRESVIQGIQVTETKSPRMPECLRRRARGADVLFEDYFGARRLWKTFRRACREVAFDIVHCASHRGVGSAVVGRLPIPVVVRLSSIPMLWRCAEGTKTTLRDHMTDWLELYQLQLADGVFAPSHLLADYAHKLFGVKACVIRSPFFIPPEEEDASVYEEHLAGKNYLLFFGKLHRRKGADVIADALPKIFADFPGIHVAFVGSALSHITPGQTIGEYVLARARGRRSQVHLLGILPRRCLLPIIRNATLVVLPSRIDNYPNTVLEAQALGKIVVGTTGSSLDEMIADGETGFLSVPDSAGSLASAVARGLSLSSHVRRRFEDNIQRHVNTLSRPGATDHLISFYQDTIDRFRKGVRRLRS